MKINRLILFLILLLSTQCTYASSEFYERYFLKNIKIGLTEGEIKELRQELTKRKISDDRFDLLERVIIKDKSFFYNYHFVKSNLRGITLSIISNKGEVDHKAAEGIYSLLNEKFIKKKDHNILRLGKDLKGYTVTAELWEDRENNKKVYFVSTNEETTLILFDSQYLNENIFFITPDKVPDLDKIVDIIEKKDKDADVKSVPVVDIPREKTVSIMETEKVKQIDDGKRQEKTQVFEKKVIVEQTEKQQKNKYININFILLLIFIVFLIIFIIYLKRK